jgi:2-desacetyl-2-hydroxyethyl bacteriochlorophyllide A dehydrogenase
MSTPDKMLAAAYFGAGQVRPEARDIPQAGADDVVIRMHRAGICGSDLHIYQHGGYTPVGTIMGHEFSGTVAGVGDNVRGVRVGQRVTANPMTAMLGLFADGAFAEYMRLPNAQVNGNLFLLPDSMSDDQGALVEPLAVALRGINHCVLDENTTIFLQGLGTIGLCALLVARQRGVRKIVAVDRPGMRLDLAKKLGAITHPLGKDGLDELLVAEFGSAQGMLPGPNVKLAIDATGNQAALNKAVSVVASRGQILILGTYVAPVSIEMTLFLAKELVLRSSLAYQEEFPEALKLVATGAIDVTPLISHHFKLGDIDAAFKAQSDPENSIKVMMDIAEA